MYWVYAAETHETFRQESGMRYQTRQSRPDALRPWNPDPIGQRLQLHRRDRLQVARVARSVAELSTQRREDAVQDPLEPHVRIRAVSVAISRYFVDRPDLAKPILEGKG